MVWAIATTTERLRFVPVSAGDASETAQLMTPTISRMLTTWPERMTREQAEARIAESIAEREAEMWIDWALRTRDRHLLAGWLGLGRKAHEDTRLTVGLWFGEAFQNIGLGGEALDAALGLARRLGAHAVDATIDVTNARSIRIFERADFRRVGERAVPAPARSGEVRSWIYERALDS